MRAETLKLIFQHPAQASDQSALHLQTLFSSATSVSTKLHLAVAIKPSPISLLRAITKSTKVCRKKLTASLTNADFGVTETTIMDMCDEVLGVGAALKARIATDRDTGELIRI